MVDTNSNFLDIVCERSMWLFSLAKLVLAGWFLLTVFAIGHAKAETAAETGAVACSGVNLLEKLKNDDPEAYQRVIDKAAEIPNGESIFWRVEKDGVEPSYLLGTMHVTNPKIVNLHAEYQAGFDASETLIVESTGAMDPAKAQAETMRLSHLTLLMDGSSLEDKIPADLHDDLKQATEEHGVPYFAAVRMQPWFVAAAIAMPECESQRKATGVKMLDARLTELAEQDGKKIVGLESIEEQLTAIATTPAEFQIQSLTDTLRLGSKVTDDMYFTMEELYLDNQVTRFMPLSEEIAKTIGSKTDEAQYQEFENKMIIGRNHVMAERAQEHLEKGKVFMAVGALHLPGKEGVVELLRGEGFTLTPVIASN